MGLFSTWPLLPSSKVSRYPAYIHDAVLLYAEAVKEMKTVRRDFWDGRQLVITLKGSNQTALQGKCLDCGRFAELRPAESVALGVVGRVITEFCFLTEIPASGKCC